jgi:hypothetical protein
LGFPFGNPLRTDQSGRQRKLPSIMRAAATAGPIERESKKKFPDVTNLHDCSVEKLGLFRINSFNRLGVDRKTSRAGLSHPAKVMLRPLLGRTWSPRPKYTRLLYEGVIFSVYRGMRFKKQPSNTSYANTRDGTGGHIRPTPAPYTYV